MKNKGCQHIQLIQEIKKPEGYVCEECRKSGSRWVHLRTCQICGATLCCDSSPGKHMSKHFNQTAHPVVISAEPGEKWFYCYLDEAFSEY